MASRREFIRNSGLLAAGFLGLKSLSLASSYKRSETISKSFPMLKTKGFGPLLPDPNRVFDLPEGFSHKILSRKGSKMRDGYFVPGEPDGMAAFSTGDGRVGIIRNHELNHGEVEKGPFGNRNQLLDESIKDSLYDFGQGKKPQQGGTSTIIFNPETHEVENEFLSLAGTTLNCAGGPTPWNTWITCEETNLIKTGSIEKYHGYNFEVPLTTDIKLADPIPLTEMGRFRHEAIAVDPKSGVIYQTEDMSNGLIYRYIPNAKGNLQEGGRLQALAILGRPSVDTRNWKSLDTPPFPQGEELKVKWIDIEDPDSPDDSLRFQGFEKGAAVFARGEGMWYGNGEIYFACTNGGRIEMGQVFRYVPSPHEGTEREASEPGVLELFIESSDKDILKNCDNLTVSPWGDLFICEDGDKPCNLVAVTPEGKFYEFGSNRYTSSELAGVCFSPDGKYLFFNIQKEGLTLAVTGPWGSLG